MMFQEILRYRKPKKNELLENWLTAVAGELAFSPRIPEWLLLLALALKSVVRFLLIFLVFENGTQKSIGTLVASICRNKYSSVCLLATSFASKLSLVWVLVSPVLLGMFVLTFWGYLARFLLHARTSAILRKDNTVADQILKHSARVFVSICLILGVIGFPCWWVLVFVHSSPPNNSLENKQYLAPGSYLNITVSVLSFLVHLFFTKIGFSWRRFHLPMAEKLMNPTDILENIGDGLLLFGGSIEFSNRVDLGIFVSILVFVYLFRLRSEIRQSWLRGSQLDQANLGILFLEAAFFGYMAFIGLAGARFGLPGSQLAAVVVGVLSPLIFRLFFSLPTLQAKRDESLLKSMWSRRANPEHLQGLMFLSERLAELQPSGKLMRDPCEYHKLDLLIYSSILNHTKECQDVWCACRGLSRSRQTGFRDSGLILKEIIANGFQLAMANSSGPRISRVELEAFIAYLNFVPASYEAIISADFLHAHSTPTVGKVRWKLAFLACKQRRDKKSQTGHFPDPKVHMGLAEMLRREDRLKRIGKLIRKYAAEFLNLQRIASNQEIRLARAKESLGRLYAIELQYNQLYETLKSNEETQTANLLFREFFRLPQKTSLAQEKLVLRNRLANAKERSGLWAKRQLDFQFLLLTVEDQFSLQGIRTSLGIERILGFNKQLFEQHSIDFLIPAHLRKAHTEAVKGFFVSGDQQLLTHPEHSLLSGLDNELVTVGLSTQVTLDWIGVKVLLFVRLRLGTKVKASVICDTQGIALHTSPRLRHVLGWPEHFQDFKFPFYLFLRNGPEKFISFLKTEEETVQPGGLISQKTKEYLNYFTDKLVADPNLVAKIQKTLPRETTVQAPLTVTEVTDQILADKFRYVRESGTASYSHPLRFCLRKIRVGPETFVYLDTLEEIYFESREVDSARANLLFRMVLLRMFLRLGVNKVSPQRSSAIQHLFTSLIAKRYLAFQPKKSNAPKPPVFNSRQDGDRARVAGKFQSSTDYEPPFFWWLKLGLFWVGSAAVALATIFILSFRSDSIFIAGKVTNSLETSYVNTAAQYLNSAKLLQLCQTSNCTVAALAIQKAALDWSKSRSLVLANSGTVFALREYLDEGTNLRPGLNAAQESFYSCLTATLSGILLKSSPFINNTEIVYRNVQTLWTEFNPRMMEPGLDGLLITSMKNFSFGTFVLSGLGLLLLCLVGAGYLFLQQKLNFLMETIQFFDFQHFSQTNLTTLAQSTTFWRPAPGELTLETPESIISDFRKFQKASVWQLFPIFRVGVVLSALLLLFVLVPYSIVRHFHLLTLSPFAYRNVISWGSMFYSIKGHQLLYPNSTVRVDSEKWAGHINNMTDIAYFGEKNFPLISRTKVFEILSSACPSTFQKNFPDCTRYFNGVLTQDFRTINSFFINQLELRSGNFPLTDPQIIDLATALTIIGLYIRQLTTAVQGIGAEQLAGLSTDVLSVFGVVYGLGAVVALAVFLMVLRPIRTGWTSSLRIIHFLDPCRAISNSRIRFFVDQLS